MVLTLALGIFIANWLVIPTVGRFIGIKQTYSDGFAIGLLAALIASLLLILNR